jgi:hypothetical protein
MIKSKVHVFTKKLLDVILINRHIILVKQLSELLRVESSRAIGIELVKEVSDLVLLENFLGGKDVFLVNFLGAEEVLLGVFAVQERLHLFVVYLSLSTVGVLESALLFVMIVRSQCVVASRPGKD